MKLIKTVLTVFLLIHDVSFAVTESCKKIVFDVHGLNRTEETWFRDYLQLGQYESWSPEESSKLRQKIMTTDIFTSAEVSEALDPSNCSVEIDVTEKWTRIPVVRGAYGGGTPLLILGGYETNAFGHLLAIGGEIRRYGNMAPGAFFFLKSPRAWRGRGLWGGELWVDRRRRDFFDNDGIVYGYVNSESWTGKFQLLYPVSDLSSSGWQAGVQAQIIHEKPATFSAQPNYSGVALGLPEDLRTNESAGNGGVIAPMIAYDDLSVEGLNYSGLKSKLSLGVSRSVASGGRFAEGEIYAFSHLPSDVNLAGRVFMASTSENTVGSVYYLGGFDSIRGLPDGIHYGNTIAYGNFEARVIAAKWKYVHLQPALFVDVGSTWMRDGNFGTGRETSLGGGIRIAIPQIYRFVIRIDYGVSVGNTKSRGFSVGLNQFFQPYKLVF